MKTATQANKHWVASPGLPMCLARHAFSLGTPESILLSSTSASTVLPVLLANDQLIVADAPRNIASGDYLVEARSVNGIQSLGSVTIDAGSRVVTVMDSPSVGAFCLALLANPTLVAPTGGTRRDPMFTDTSKYAEGLASILRSLLFSAEDVIRTAARRGLVRIVAVVPRPDTDTPVALVEEAMPNIARPRQREVSSYLRRLNVEADVALLLQGSLDYTRASATFTVDGSAGATTNFTFDGAPYRHNASTRMPGAATVSYFSFDISHTPLHEFAHAASETRNGRIIDLYHDACSTGYLDVNKRSGRPIPAIFGSYNSQEYGTDEKRNHLGYGAGWQSFHPALQEKSEPNLMDDYWQAHSDPLDCRLDGLTHRWLSDRMAAKAR